jgi:alpha-glucosidase
MAFANFHFSDGGFWYDIADYTSIDPIFGKMADFDQFLAAAHGRGLKVILDLVPNHTSDQHPWFGESRSSLTNSKRNWYIWERPGPDGEPPNNWLSEFGGSAWELDPVTRQYYYHAFLAAQPDLNWRNPSVRAAIYDVMRFWLARGVDGFRADAMWHLIKDEHFRNNPSHPEFRAGDPPPQAVIPLYTADRPEIHEVIREMRSVVDEFTDRVLIGEIYLPLERLMTYYGRDLDGVHFPFNFSLLSATWHAATIAKIIDEYEAALPHGGWPNWVLGNHDRPRIASRIGTAQARVAAMLLLTLRGTPTIYYEEIGMEQVEIAPDRIRDPFEINVPGKGLGRDGSRTPMQWDASPFGGFSRVEPWLPIAPQYRSQNVAVQKLQGGSLLLLYQQLLSLRRSRTSVRCGSYLPIETDGDVLLYVRHHENERSLVALNFSSKPAFVPLPADMGGGNVLISTLGNNRQASGGDQPAALPMSSRPTSPIFFGSTCSIAKAK